jgi:hypothetical protein
MPATSVLDDARTTSMRYDPESERILAILGDRYGMIRGTLVRMALRRLPQELSEYTVEYIRQHLNSMGGKRTTWIEDSRDAEHLEDLRARYGLTRRGILRWAIRELARSEGIEVRDTAMENVDFEVIEAEA